MRPSVAVLLVLALTHCAPATAPTRAAGRAPEEVVPDAQFCARPAEKLAMQVAALQSRLMVTALACDASTQFNAFGTANKPSLVQQNKELAGYFNRNYGRRGQAEQDAYTTALANAQSRRRTIDGARFCSDGQQLFAAVAAIKSPAELAPLAASQTISQPMNVAVCGGAQASAKP